MAENKFFGEKGKEPIRSGKDLEKLGHSVFKDPSEAHKLSEALKKDAHSFKGLTREKFMKDAKKMEKSGGISHDAANKIKRQFK